MSIFVRKITIWSYGYFINILGYGLREGVLPCVGGRKNRQIKAVKNP